MSLRSTFLYGERHVWCFIPVLAILSGDYTLSSSADEQIRLRYRLFVI